MKHWKQILTALTAILIISIVAALCISKQWFSTGDDNEPVDTKTGKIELKVLTSWGGSDTKAAQLQKLLNQFEEENPDISIKNQSVPGAEFLFALKTDFAQGNDPDLFGLWPGSDIKALVKAGKVADLTGILNDDIVWKSSFGADAWSYVTYNNKVYGVPFEIIYECMFLNKDLFQKHHVKVPQNYNELVTAVKAFRKKGVIPIAWSATAEGSFLYQNIVAKLGGKAEVEKPVKNGKFNKCFVDGLKYLKELYALRAFPDNAFLLDDNGRRSLFLEKKAAMIVEGSWFIGPGALGDNDDSIEMTAFPAFGTEKSDPSSMIYGIGNGNFHISTAAYQNRKKKEAAVKLLKYLTSQEASGQFQKQAGFICNVVTPDKHLKAGKLYLDGIMLVAKSKELIGPVDSFVDRNIWEDVLVPGIPEVMEGGKTPESVIRKIEEMYKRNNIK